MRCSVPRWPDFRRGWSGRALCGPSSRSRICPRQKRLAPHATATAATVSREGADVAWGRLVLCTTRRGPKAGMALPADQLSVRGDRPGDRGRPDARPGRLELAIEALDAGTPGYAVPSGTVTRVTTEGFGGKADEEPVHGYEQRASWSPAPAGGDLAGPGVRAAADDPETLDIAAHVTAWCDPLAAAAGLPPLAIGTLPRAAAAGRRSRAGGAGDRSEPARPGRGAGRAPARAAGWPATGCGDRRELARVARGMAEGTGPVAVDAERASGYRYGHRAYLVQFRREARAPRSSTRSPVPTCPAWTQRWPGPRRCCTRRRRTCRACPS